jgi:hypothetical protein
MIKNWMEEEKQLEKETESETKDPKVIAEGD